MHKSSAQSECRSGKEKYRKSSRFLSKARQIVEDKKTKTPPLAKKAGKAVDAADCDPLGASDPLAALDPLTSAATAVASSGGYDMPVRRREHLIFLKKSLFPL